MQKLPYSLDAPRQLNARRLRTLRRERRLRQQMLGVMMGQDQPYVSHLERGVDTGVSMTTRHKLATALGVSMDHLLQEVPPGTPEGTEKRTG